jgi:diacylglycerol kinase family enzyme
MAHQPVTLGVLPLGTGNLLAHTLGMGRLEDAVAAIAHGHNVAIDLAIGNDRFFIDTLSIGLSDAVAREANRKMKRVLGVFAYAVAAVKVFLTHERFAARIEAAGQVIETQTHQLVVANGAYIGPFLRAAPGASIANRHLVVYAMGGYSRWRLLRHTIEVALGWQVRDPEMHYLETEALTITTEPPQVVTLDGEPHGTTPITIRLVPAALQVYASPAFLAEVSEVAIPRNHVFRHIGRGLLGYRN